MSLVGRWKIVEAIRINENFEPEWAPIEEILADEELEPEDKIVYSSFMDFTEDGRVLNLSPIPEDLSQEEIDEVVENFEYELYEGYIKLTEFHWKTENGKYYLETDINRSVYGEEDGEESSPWEEISVVDGIMETMTLKLAKAE